LSRETPPRGAVLIIGLGMLSVVALLIFVLARSAVISNDKTRAIALADAAAKSVATWYAQILNYDAYSNRAIAANEIMMAQAVTLSAWTQYAQTLAQNMGSLAAAIPATQSIATWIQESAQISHQMTKSGAAIELPMRSGYTKMLQTSQHMMHAAATPFAAQAMVNEVIWTGDSRFFGQIIPSSNISAFSGFSRNRAGSDRAPLVSMVQQSQDGFTRNRGFDSRLYLMPSVGCIPTSMDSAFGKLVKRGGTWLSPDYSSWEAGDTLSIHTWRRRSRWNWRCSGLRESIPLAWGAADADPGAGGGISSDPVGLSANPSSWSTARSNAVDLSGYLGFSAYRELTLGNDAARKDASVRVPVLIRLPVSKMQKVTAGQQATEAERDADPVKNLWSLSVAEVFFQRPVDTLANTATREFANLFSPFWGSRLAAPTLADRSVSLVMSRGESQP